MLTKPLKIGQISDIHIGDDESLVQGIDVRENFLKALHSKSMSDIDLLVLSGDLSDEKGKSGGYYFVKEQIQNLKIPVCIIPGNHDDLSLMSDIFNLSDKIHNEKCYYKYNLNSFPLFFLDSACGEVSKDQLMWLKEEASKESGEILLFMHHPPCFCNHRFMDLRYSLKNKEEVQSVLTSIPNLTHIFCGHYHCHIDVNMGRQKVHVAPATQMQIDSNSPHFVLKSSAPEWVGIEIGENYIESQVYFK